VHFHTILATIHAAGRVYVCNPPVSTPLPYPVLYRFIPTSARAAHLLRHTAFYKTQDHDRANSHAARACEQAQVTTFLRYDKKVVALGVTHLLCLAVPFYCELQGEQFRESKCESN
jgi:hypothetical protein